MNYSPDEDLKWVESAVDGGPKSSTLGSGAEVIEELQVFNEKFFEQVKRFRSLMSLKKRKAVKLKVFYLSLDLK